MQKFILTLKILFGVSTTAMVGCLIMTLILFITGQFFGRYLFNEYIIAGEQWFKVVLVLALPNYLMLRFIIPYFDPSWRT